MKGKKKNQNQKTKKLKAAKRKKTRRKKKKIVKKEVGFLKVSIVIQTLPYKGMCGLLVDQIKNYPKNVYFWV